MTIHPSGKVWFVAGTLFAALSVVIGAFGAHGLESMLQESLKESADQGAVEKVAKRLANWDTGARYQMYHAFGLMFTGLLIRNPNSRLFSAAGFLFVAGILFFSGTLYSLVLTEQTWLGAVAPIGGLANIIGWCLLGLAAWRIPPMNPSTDPNVQ